MSIPESISNRFKVFIMTGMIAILALISGLSLLHTYNSLRNDQDNVRKLTASRKNIELIEKQILNLSKVQTDTIRVNASSITALAESLQSFLTDVENVQSLSITHGDSALQSLVSELAVSIKNQYETIDSLDDFYIDNNQDFINSQSNFLNTTLGTYDKIETRIHQLLHENTKRDFINLSLILFLSILIIAVIIGLNAVKMKLNYSQLFAFIQALEDGKTARKLKLNYSYEFSEIAERLNRFQNKQNKKIAYLKSINEGSDPDIFQAEKSDVFGTEIKMIAEHLNTIHQKEHIRKNEEHKRNWTSNGIAQFAEILRSERENVKELSFRIIQKLVSYLKLEMGTIFLASATEDKRNLLTTIAAYAYDRRKYLNKTFEFGEGLPGTCALEGEKIYINEIPDDYSDVISGVGHAKPKYILLVPLKIENQIFGILELASFRGLEEFELDFVDQLAESIASTLQAVKTNEQTAFLLQQSQEQADKLMRQEEAMKINMSALENAQKESLKKESEITGILNAMNESSLVAEFALNGRYTHINDKFLELLESPSEQILGKHHNEFAQVDKYSDEYKLFWTRLKEGEIISKEEQLKLYTGKEIWLQQSFTPIKNAEGKIYKILNIAVDITFAKQQQENLLKQANEITRQHLELESLNDAVNAAIIKCELDKEGVILNSNSNFEQSSGYNRKEILGRNYRLFLKNIEVEQFEKIWSEVLKGKTYQGAIRRTKPTGEEIWLMSTFSPVKNEDGEIYKIYFLALDITEKRLKYQLLEEANKEIDRLRKR